MFNIGTQVVAAISTAPAQGAISIVRVTGEGAINIADKVFRGVSGKPLTELKGYSASYGEIYYEGVAIDDGVATVFRAPKSYTGEDMVEITCHGNPIIATQLLKALIAAGAEPAGAGEFTKRAFLNGKLDLTKAEAVSELISANGEAALRLARRKRSGALSDKIDSLCEKLTEIAAGLAVWLDYPDDEDMAVPYDLMVGALSECLGELIKLSDSYKSGQKITQGISVAIVGSPNAGKSTLMNLLSKEDKSIVTHYAGTTRDVVENRVELGNISLRLLDTAGIRKTDDPVEKIGVQRAYSELLKADILLFVIDGSHPLSEEDKELLLTLKGRNMIAVLTRKDVGVFEGIYESVCDTFGECEVVYLDGLSGDGILLLEEKLISISGITLGDDILITNEREFLLVKKAVSGTESLLESVKEEQPYDILGVEIDEVLSSLWEIVGKNASAEVISSIFEKFCVGK